MGERKKIRNSQKSEEREVRRGEEKSEDAYAVEEENWILP